jgi:hypothetical protein
MAKGQIQKKNIKKKPLKTKAEKRAEKITRKNKRPYRGVPIDILVKRHDVARS